MVILVLLGLVFCIYCSIKLKVPKCVVCGHSLSIKDVICPHCGYDRQPFSTTTTRFTVHGNGVYYKTTSDSFARLVFQDDGYNTYNFVIYFNEVFPSDIVFIELVLTRLVGNYTWFDFNYYINGVPMGTISKYVKSHSVKWVALERLPRHEFD